MAALPTRRPRPYLVLLRRRDLLELVRAELLHVSLKDLDLVHRPRARHVIDQLGERHPKGGGGERVRRIAHEVAVYEVLGVELVEPR